MSSLAEQGRPPSLSNSAVASLIKDYFCFSKVEESTVKELPSYVDRNIYFKGSTVTGQGDYKEYVLKLSNPLFTSFDILDCINSLLDYLQSMGITKCICPQNGRRGQSTIEITGGELLCYETEEVSEVKEPGMKYLMRIVTFIPGQCFDDVDKHYVTSKLLYSVGNFIGRVDDVLYDGFHSPGLEKQFLFGWDFRKLSDLRELLPNHDNIKQRELVERVLDDFEKYVSPLIPKFKTGFMYGDASGQNIVVKKSDSEEYELAGIIDFGHAISSCYVFDLGILLAYIMIENLDHDGVTPMEFVGPMLKGFVDAFPLTAEEVGSLYYITMVRLCQSAIIGTGNYKREPWNTYFLTTPTKCWRLLELMLTQYSKEDVDKIWSTAITN